MATETYVGKKIYFHEFRKPFPIVFQIPDFTIVEKSFSFLIYGM